MLKLKDIKKGQLFYESERGLDVEMTALEDACIARLDDSNAAFFVCRVATADGELVLHENIRLEEMKATACALRLYREPQYGRVI